jgi:hypothetical protein
VDWHWLNDLQLGVGYVLLEDSIDAVAVEGIVEVLVNVMLVKELREDLSSEFLAYFSILEVANQVVVGETSCFVLLNETLDQCHQPYPLVQDCVVLQ